VVVDRLQAVRSGGILIDGVEPALDHRVGHVLPDTMKALVADVGRRAAQLIDIGHVRVIECADSATATLIAGDRTLRSLCVLIGDRQLAVSPEQEVRFRKALLACGYVCPGRADT
jgi:hypothetical protein